MRNPIVPVILLLACSAAPALAGGLDLNWGSGCYPESPQTLKTFACNTNSGAASLTASFVPAVDQPGFVGLQATLVFQIQSTTVPDWWQFVNAGACRQNALSSSADFTAAPQTVCVDPWLGVGQGGTASYITGDAVNPPATGRVRVSIALAQPSPLYRSVEYYGFRVTFNYSKTVGTGACSGCTAPVTAVLNEIRSYESNNNVDVDTSPVRNGCVVWQAGSACQATVARNTTWGALQSLYR